MSEVWVWAAALLARLTTAQTVSAWGGQRFLQGLLLTHVHSCLQDALSPAKLVVCMANLTMHLITRGLMTSVTCPGHSGSTDRDHAGCK